MKMMILAAALVAGCTPGNYKPTSAPSTRTNETHKVSYLAVGMEFSARFGECYGCERDAKAIDELMKCAYGYDGTLLVSGKATKANVVKALKEGISSTPEDGLFLLFYSGHGGQERLGGKEPDGADAMDEFLCLYDTYMLDDEIWDIVSKCRGRVFMYFDACHSATMYRSVSYDLGIGAEVRKRMDKARAMGFSSVMPSSAIEKTKGFTFRPDRFVGAQAMDSSASGPSPRILCWSGCKESEYSYGGDRGGTMTIALMGTWKRGITYSSAWSSVYALVQNMQPSQHPVQTKVGEWPEPMEVFR